MVGNGGCRKAATLPKYSGCQEDKGCDGANDDGGGEGQWPVGSGMGVVGANGPTQARGREKDRRWTAAAGFAVA